MEKLTLHIRDEDAMRNFAVILKNVLTRGSVLVLTGELGAGKTFLMQEVAKNLGITCEVKSPTFTIMHIYEEGCLPLIHFDLYRLDEARDLEGIGFFDYAGHGDYLTAIEWGDKFEELLPPSYLKIDIQRGKKENERIVTLSFVGKMGEKIFDALKASEEILTWEK